MLLPKVMAENKWLTIHRRGLVFFVLFNGFLVWGFTTAALWSGAMTVLVTDFKVARDVPRAFMIFPMVGIFWALATWWMNDRFFKKQIK